jgi:hypothetical protein
MGKTVTLLASTLSILLLSATGLLNAKTESEFKEKHGIWDPVPELTITSPYDHSNTFSMSNSMPESTLTLCQGRLYPPVRDFGFSLWLFHDAKQLNAQDIHTTYSTRC